MPIIHATDGPIWEPLPGWKMTGLASPSRGSAELAVWHVHIDPHIDGPLHRVDHDIVFFVLAGTAAITVEGERTNVPAGDAFIIPAQAERKLGNTQDVECDLVNAMPAAAQSVRSDGSASSIPWAL